MRRRVLWIAVALLLASGATVFVACNKAQARVGPNGGDVVSVPNTGAKAEVIGNPDTGEVVIRTWDEKLERPESLPREPLVLGEGERRLELMPHAMADDPEGRSSRFYGRAEWLRGGRVERGWIECCGGARVREEFAWSSGWEAGRRHGDMWQDMRGHGMGMAAGEHGRMGHRSGAPMGFPSAEPSPSMPTPQEPGDR